MPRAIVPAALFVTLCRPAFAAEEGQTYHLSFRGVTC